MSYHKHLNNDEETVNRYYKPYWYIISGCLMQMINFFVYSFLLYLHETGALNRCFMKIHSSKGKFVFPEESVSEDFYAYNNLRNPLIYLQNLINNQNSDNNNNLIVNDINNNNESNDINSNKIIINDSRSQTESSIDIDTSSRNNLNTIDAKNINIINEIYLNSIKENQNNQVNPMNNNIDSNNINNNY